MGDGKTVAVGFGVWLLAVVGTICFICVAASVILLGLVTQIRTTIEKIAQQQIIERQLQPRKIQLRRFFKFCAFGKAHVALIAFQTRCVLVSGTTGGGTTGGGTTGGGTTGGGTARG